MSKDNMPTDQIDMSFLSEYFSDLERQGPGSRTSTIKALSFIDNLTDQSLIADIGCGTGGQTIVIAGNAPGNIIGIDLFPEFIDVLNKNALDLDLQDRVKGEVGSMEDLPFEDKSLDLIWSEGAIYNIGFEKGLKDWHRFLKMGGFIAVTELSWFTEMRPSEINDYWNQTYPGIDTIPNKLAQLQQAGYIPIAMFILPEESWTINYYEPQTKVQEKILEKYPGNSAVREFIDGQIHEAMMYSRYKEFYGYVFYIGRKI